MHQEMTRRGFLEAGAATVAAGKLVDGGFVPVSNPGKPERSTAIVPAGAKSLRAFRAKCVGCQLCVRVCPEKVLRPSHNSKRFLLPEMGFEHGYCRPSCTRCAEVCPAGAIEKITREEKLHTHIGRATWHKDRCIAAKSKVRCNVCERHCPVKAIVLINNIPVVDAAKCIGCGACENLCPSRPMPAITVEGCEVHRCDVPVTANEVAYELSHPGESKIQEQV